MLPSLLLSLTTALALVAFPGTAAGQEKATELTAGLFGFSNLSSQGENLVRVGTGGTFVAAGFYLSPELAVEPAFSLAYQKVSSFSQTQWGLGAAFPYYFDRNWGHTGVYAAPRMQMAWYSCSNCDGASQLSVGAALGYKFALNDAAALRLQASLDYSFENNNFDSYTTLGAALGLSVFLR